MYFYNVFKLVLNAPCIMNIIYTQKNVHILFFQQLKF